MQGESEVFVNMNCSFFCCRNPWVMKEKVLNDNSLRIWSMMQRFWNLEFWEFHTRTVLLSLIGQDALYLWIWCLLAISTHVKSSILLLIWFHSGIVVASSNRGLLGYRRFSFPLLRTILFNPYILMEVLFRWWFRLNFERLYRVVPTISLVLLVVGFHSHVI